VNKDQSKKHVLNFISTEQNVKKFLLDEIREEIMKEMDEKYVKKEKFDRLNKNTHYPVLIRQLLTENKNKIFLLIDNQYRKNSKNYNKYSKMVTEMVKNNKLKHEKFKKLYNEYDKDVLEFLFVENIGYGLNSAHPPLDDLENKKDLCEAIRINHTGEDLENLKILYKNYYNEDFPEKKNID
jgi:hypothetical protein